MDGLLIIDKPAGITSHDVVARGRRILRERRVGHTGTLDPAATGVLPLVVGRATRLARFLSASTKTYDAEVALGLSTDTADAAGAPIGSRYEGPLPTRDAIDRALDEFRGTFLQRPPAYSAKRIGGTRSYALARASDLRPLGDLRPQEDLRPRAVSVSVQRIEIVAVVNERVTLQVECSAGFYVRSLAHDLGDRLGVGAHLAGLRRTRSGDYRIEDAAALDAMERDPGEAARRLVPLASMLPGLPGIVLTAEGVRRVTHGRDLGAGDTVPAIPSAIRDPTSAIRNPQSAMSLWPAFVRLLDPAGDLVAIGEPSATSGLLHPSIVLM